MFYALIDGTSVKLSSTTMDKAMEEVAALCPKGTVPILRSVDVQPKRKEKFNPEHYELGGEGG